MSVDGHVGLLVLVPLLLKRFRATLLVMVPEGVGAACLEPIGVLIRLEDALPGVFRRASTFNKKIMILLVCGQVVEVKKIGFGKQVQYFDNIFEFFQTVEVSLPSRSFV